MVSFACRDSTSKTNQHSKNNIFPLTFKEYKEADDPNISDQDEWKTVPSSLQVSFGSTDIRYSKSLPPKGKKTKSWRGTAWKGERVSAQIVLWTSGNADRISLKTNGLENITGEKIDPKYKDLIISKIPSARLGEPEDVANAVLFLASDQSNYINGETLHVNGGMYMA